MIFKDLLERHFENISLIDRIEEIWDEGVSLNEINICDILPETETIMIHEKYNVCYHGRECEAYAVKLYKYNNYMITYTFDSDGNDLEVFGIEEYVDAIEIKLKKKKILKNKSWSDNICKLLEVSVTVQSLDDFSYEIFLNEIDNFIWNNYTLSFRFIPKDGDTGLNFRHLYISNKPPFQSGPNTIFEAVDILWHSVTRYNDLFSPFKKGV